MPGVVGSVKRTPRFDARGGRKGKTDPQIRCSGYWIASLRSQWREERGAGLLYFVRNDGCEVGGLLHFARNDGRRSCWIASLRSQWRGAGCWIASFRSQWRGAGDWIASLRSQWREEELLDCFTLFAMTGSGVAGLLHFAHNDGRGGWRPWKEGANEGEIQIFCSFRYFIF